MASSPGDISTGLFTRYAGNPILSPERWPYTINAVMNAGAAEVRTAVAFKTGSYVPDFHQLATESAIVLPWDREVLIDGELLTNPLYRDLLEDVR